MSAELLCEDVENWRAYISVGSVVFSFCCSTMFCTFNVLACTVSEKWRIRRTGGVFPGASRKSKLLSVGLVLSGVYSVTCLALELEMASTKLLVRSGTRLLVKDM